MTTAVVLTSAMAVPVEVVAGITIMFKAVKKFFEIFFL
jgi:hypothetical protein